MMLAGLILDPICFQLMFNVAIGRNLDIYSKDGAREALTGVLNI